MLVRECGLVLLGLALVAVGAILLLTQSASFGWTAYAPLSSTTFVLPGPPLGMVAGNAPAQLSSAS